MSDLVDVLIGHGVALRDGPQFLRRARATWSRCAGSRIPADVVDADLIAQRHPERIADEAGQEVLPEHPGGQLAAEVQQGPGGVLSNVRSTRSRKYGIQPVPPSDGAILMSRVVLDHS